MGKRMDRQTGRISNAAVQVPYRNVMVAVKMTQGVKVLQLVKVLHLWTMLSLKMFIPGCPCFGLLSTWITGRSDHIRQFLFLQDKIFL